MGGRDESLHHAFGEARCRRRMPRCRMLHAMGASSEATTGRARRCGWFDAVATRHATM